jgi:repressor LexA
MLVQEDITGYEYVSVEDVRGGEYFFLKVKGDSMIGKRICEGDLVLVRKQPALEDGQIGVFITEEGATIKTFHRQGNLALLTPANSAYKPIVVLLKDLTIVGEVVEAKIKFNGR